MTITITHPQARNHRTRHVSLLALLLVTAIVAIFVVTQIGGSSTTVQPGTVFGTTQAPAAVDMTGLAEWAEANGVSGLSAASAVQSGQVSGAVDMTGLAEWAEANGVSGLSVASATPID